MACDEFESRMPRNNGKRIAEVFFDKKIIEQWGSGVRRMFKEAKAPGLPEPEIIEVGMRVRFIVHLAESIAVQPESKEIKGILDIPQQQAEIPPDS
ncbi:hypothetical protein MSSIH_1346 [Methanosarcina siciliae HI350]|uniref:Uncharacterized protein n=1 Tax=Methanosarcina siciliae HI350 TaxID=1434119 RepID=A0A0E3LAH6_9EURY|nr:ATP-binding protein [Methanosarcina siciliae]AKB32036.1 hypothetical protein MSSIH_1346 [Methanosarcina siciliae HI350]